MSDVPRRPTASGGWLKSGGSHPNSGPKPKAVRAKLLGGCDQDWVVDVSHGRKVIKTDNGDTRRPTFVERMDALKFCAQYGLGTITKQEVTGEDGGPIEVRAESYDLSKLSVEQLADLENLRQLIEPSES